MCLADFMWFNYINCNGGWWFPSNSSKSQKGSKEPGQVRLDPRPSDAKIVMNKAEDLKIWQICQVSPVQRKFSRLHLGSNFKADLNTPHSFMMKNFTRCVSERPCNYHSFKYSQLEVAQIIRAHSWSLTVLKRTYTDCRIKAWAPNIHIQLSG